MKKIKLNEKLSLKKETVAELNDKQLASVKGGTIMSESCVTSYGCTQYTGKCCYLC